MFVCSVCKVMNRYNTTYLFSCLNYLLFSSYAPLKKSEISSYGQDTSKSISLSRSLELSHLIGDDK